MADTLTSDDNCLRETSSTFMLAGMHRMFDTIDLKVVAGCFLLPLLLTLCIQWLRNIMSTGGGVGFEEPGIGWVLMFTVINGGLLGVTIPLLYLAFTKSVARNIWLQTSLTTVSMLPFSLWCVFMGLGQSAQNDIIFDKGYFLFYPLLASQAFPSDDPVPVGVAPILPPETKVKIKMDGQDMEIVTGIGLLRTYKWAGDKRSVTMKVVRQQGKKELHFPVNLGSFKSRHEQDWFDWKMHDGTAKCCAIEETKDFPSATKLIEWIQEQESIGNHRVYRDDGLMISCTKHCEPHTLWIEIYQLTVNGKKPQQIAGARNDFAEIESVANLRSDSFRPKIMPH